MHQHDALELVAAYLKQLTREMCTMSAVLDSLTLATDALAAQVIATNAKIDELKASPPVPVDMVPEADVVPFVDKINAAVADLAAKIAA